MAIAIKKKELLFRVFLTTTFLICLYDLITSVRIYLYNDLEIEVDFVIRVLEIIISFEELLYIHSFIEYFNQVTKGVDDEKKSKRKEN